MVTGSASGQQIEEMTGLISSWVEDSFQLSILRFRAIKMVSNLQINTVTGKDEKSLQEIENAIIPNKRLAEGKPTPPPRKQSVSKDASIPNKRLPEGIPTPPPRKQSVSKDGGLQGSSSIYGLHHRPIQRGTLERQSFGQLVQQDNDHVKLREVVSNGYYCMPDPALDKYFPLQGITGFTQSGGRFVQEDNVYGRQDGRNDYPYYSSIIQDIRPLSDKSTHFEKSHNFIAILQEGKLACENGLFFPGTYNDSITIAKNGKTEVSLAYHKMLGWVAVKKIPHEYNTGYHRLDVGIGHRHPNISIFFNRFKIKTHLYIVMELHDFNLSEYLKKYRDLPFHHRCRLVLEMFEGLKFLHGRNIIHRDIKPENLLINTDKVLRIADFGISRCTDKNEHHRTVHIGAKLWVPPILNDTQNEVDIHEKNDIYAAALVVFFIFKLEYPFLARIDDKFTLTYLIESKEKLSFLHELNDPFLQEYVRCILSMYEDISAAKAIEMLHNSHRVKEISYEGSNQIFERSSGKRIALLVKSEHFSLEDVYKLDEPLKACDYEVIQTECNFLTLVQNLKKKATQLKSKEIHVFVYLSCHTYWNAYDQETVLEFDDGKKKGLTCFLSEIESAFKENYEKIINVIAVINGFRLYQNKSEKLIPVSLRGNFLVFFPSPSVELKMTLTNTPGLLPFHKFIKPATKLNDIWTAVEKREGVPFQIDCYKPVFDCFGKNGKKLFEFVF